jgi:hypothetical protein
VFGRNTESLPQDALFLVRHLNTSAMTLRARCYRNSADSEFAISPPGLADRDAAGGIAQGKRT